MSAASAPFGVPDPITTRTEHVVLLWLAGRLDLGSLRNTAEILTVLASAQEHRRSGNAVTVRGIYYEHTELFRHNQANAARAIAQACRLLSSSPDAPENLVVTREDLGFRASPKGFVVGPLKFTVRSSCSLFTVDVQAAGTTGSLLPTGNVSLENFSLTSKATWILVVEKEATAATLASSPYFSDLQCIMVCGKGYPCRATQRFLSSIHSTFPQLSLGAIVDCDPHGIQILLTYAFGGTTSRNASEFSTPSIQWMGLLPSYASAHFQQNRMPWNTVDTTLTAKLLSRVKKAAMAATAASDFLLARKLEGWHAEVACLNERKTKAEIQSLQLTSPNGTAAHVLDLAHALGFL